MRYTTCSVEETRLLGSRFASKVEESDVVVLDGGLGCGKTEFVRGFVEFFEGTAFVRSPSFSIVNTYVTSRLTIYHFDFYRLENAKELNEIGFGEYCSGSGVCLIEWGLMFPEILPPDTVVITFNDIGNDKRDIEIPVDI